MHFAILQAYSSLHSTLNIRPKPVHPSALILLQRRQSVPSQPQSSCQGSKLSSASWNFLTPAAATSSPRTYERLSNLDGKAPSVSLSVRTWTSAVEESVQEVVDQRITSSNDNDDDFDNVLEIIKREDKFRYHKIPDFKALRLKLGPVLVLQVLRHKEVKPSNKWKFFVWAKKQMKYKHTEETYNTIIATLLDIRKFTSIYFLLEAMYKDGVSLKPETCVKMAKTFGRAGMVERAVHALNHMTRLGSPATTRHLNSVVTELLKGRHHYKAYIAYREMARGGCEPDGDTFKLLFRVLARVEKVELASHVFDDMQARDCEPDVETASAVVGILCRAGRIEDALLVFEKVKQKGVKLNVKVYNSLLASLGKTSKVERALEIFEEIRIRGFHPDKGSSEALLELLVGSGKEEDARKCRGYMETDALPRVAEPAK